MSRAEDLPDIAEREREGLARLAERLRRGRPAPAAAFHASLRRRLLARPTVWRPARLAPVVAGFAAAGSALMLLAAGSLLGVGPLAP